MTATMNDHAPRIRAQQQQAAELEVIKELETRVAPLIWLVYAAAFAAVLGIALHGWQKYAELYAEHEAMVKCINGQAVGVDTAVMRCTLRENKPLLLTGEVKS